MNKTSIIFLTFFCPFLTTAQVTFENFTSLDQLFEQARQQKKLVFIQIESANCDQCNDVAIRGLNSTQLKEKFAVNFISTKIKESVTVYFDDKSRGGTCSRCKEHL